tara:strand:+ start:828 stop:1943 length:1116 start_codon:yes stop_codon:yes gene_type:complete
MIDNNTDNLICTPNIPNLIWDELEAIHSGMGEQMHRVDSYEDLVGIAEVGALDDNDEQIVIPYLNDLAFFDALLTKGKVNIHVDTTAYDKIFSKFLKIFFPSMSRDVAWKTYNIFRTNSQLLNTTSFVWGGNGEQTQIDNAAAWIPRTKTEFLSVYDTVSRDLEDDAYTTFIASAKQKIGIEFMIANRLAGDESYDVFLGEKMYKLMASRVNDEGTFLKSTLFNNMFRPWVQTVLGVTVNANDDLLDLKDTNDMTRWVFDDTERYFTADYQTNHPNIRFSAIRTAMITAVTGSTLEVEEALTNESMDFVHDNVSVQNFTSANITTILNTDKTYLGPSVFEIENRLKVNALFIGYMYKLSVDADAELSMFSL